MITFIAALLITYIIFGNPDILIKMIRTFDVIGRRYKGKKNLDFNKINKILIKKTIWYLFVILINLVSTILILIVDFKLFFMEAPLKYIGAIGLLYFISGTVYSSVKKHLSKEKKPLSSKAMWLRFYFNIALYSSAIILLIQKANQ